LIALILPAHYKILFHLAHYTGILQELRLQNKDFFLNSISPQVLPIDLTSIQISGARIIITIQKAIAPNSISTNHDRP
jgi:hypothetical protein